MRKNTLIILMLSLISFGAFAQDRSKMREKRPNPEKRAEMQTKKLQEQVNLNDEQYQKMYAINLEKVKTNQAKMEARQAEMKAERAEYEKQLESVLTPEQLKKLKEDRAKMVKERREHKGEREHKRNVQKKQEHKNRNTKRGN